MTTLLWTEWGILLSFLGCFLLFHLSSRTKSKGPRLPPGPPGKLILGNILDIPTRNPWEKFTEWKTTYGDLVHLKVLNRNMIIVNSADVAHDLFDKRSSLYSDRVDLPMMNDLMGLDWNFGLMRYGDLWRRHRKAFDQRFQRNVMEKYQNIQINQTRGILRRLHESPDQFQKHLRHLSGAMIMEITYGIQVLPENDPYIRTAELVVAATDEAGAPGAFLVDILPILKHVPVWFPGAGFRRKALAWRKLIAEMAIAPFDAVKKDWIAGTAAPSVLVSMLEDLSTRSNPPPDEEVVVRNATGAAYMGGTDTTFSSFTAFFLAMVLHPDVQQNAQDELDAVVGMNRLPDFEDRKDLPYIDALCKEVLRWHPVLPLGVPHCATHDDVYGDFRIPQGSLVFANSWAMLHDERIFGPEPHKFNPERFLKVDAKSPTFAFGFGRRICPGRHLGDNALFIAVASILKVFRIKQAVDIHGERVPVAEDFTSGLMSSAKSFQCDIELRSADYGSILSDL